MNTQHIIILHTVGASAAALIAALLAVPVHAEVFVAVPNELAKQHGFEPQAYEAALSRIEPLSLPDVFMAERTTNVIPAVYHLPAVPPFHKTKRTRQEVEQITHYHT